MEKLDSKIQDDLSGAMMSNVVDHLLPDNTAKLSINLHYDVIGQATQRNGSTQLGDTKSGTCRGLFNYVSSDGATDLVFSVFDTIVYYSSGGGFTATESVATTDKVRFASFLDSVFRVGGGSPTRSWDGSWGVTNLSSAPSGKYIETFKERVYIAGDSTKPDRLYFSDIASTAGTISWTSTNYIDVNPEDGNNITALKKISNLLLIWKERTMYRWNGSSTDAEVVVDIGTTSQESVASAKGMVFFFNPQGIYMTNGGYPVEISRAVANLIKVIPATFYKEVAGFCDDDHYYCSIGDVTVDGRSFTNLWLVYTISTKNWHTYTWADSFRNLVKYVTLTGEVTYIGGDTDGMVQTVFSGTTDNGSPINYEYETKEWHFTSPATVKSIHKVACFVENGVGAKLLANPDKKGYAILGEVKERINIFKGFAIKGNQISLKLVGSNRSTPIKFQGFEFIDYFNEGYVKI